jgi:hypothetical protein
LHSRYDDINYIVGVDPIGVGELTVLVISDCDTSQTTVVPKIDVGKDEDVDGVVTTTLTVTLGDGVRTDMPHLKSSSYESVFYENSYIQYIASDISPDDPIVKDVPCTTVDECRDAASSRMGIGTNYFYVGEYATSGCFYKNGRAYWSTNGDPTIVETAGVLQLRLYCTEVYYIDDVVVDDDNVVTTTTTCATKEQCDARRAELEIQNFFSGNFPTKGCFTKDGTNGITAYWSEGGSEEDMSTTDLPALQKRITCYDDAVVDDGGDVCVTQDQCDAKRSDLGIERFVAGIFPTKGCFSKAGVNGVVAYWSDGGTSEEMSIIDLPGVQERIACEGGGGTSTPPPACESGPMADPAKSCEGGRFCKLDVGACNAKVGVFVGVCETKPEMCIEIYDPVSEAGNSGDSRKSGIFIRPLCSLLVL